ncbi:MAG: diaminopimelate epimerase [Gammaproteobacteria bacterium]
MTNSKAELRSHSKIAFTKMQGLGNDFIIIDATQQPLYLTPPQIRHLADRHYGVGCDQLLILLPATTPKVDFSYQIFNADGSSAEQCGNGARCLGRYIYEKKHNHSSPLRLAAPTGEIELYLEANGMINVNMGLPIFSPESIPFQADKQADVYSLSLHDGTFEIGVVGLGNPHAVFITPDLASAPVSRWGAEIESHVRFPHHTNVGFMQIINRQHIHLRVYERGVGETLACGSGACAAMVIGRLWQQLDPQVAVDLPGGRLHIRWEGIAAPVWMSGPAEIVFEGYIALQDRL